MTVTQPHPPPLPTEKRSQVWLWISLANLASLAYGLAVARDKFRHIFVDFHLVLGPLTRIVLAITPLDFIIVAVAVAAWSIYVQRTSRSSARANRFHIWIIIASIVASFVYAWAMMMPLTALVEGMSK
ncbi:MAG TPA: hypothetical protein VHY37_04440 [Tepidisphaeraceae bacterium]|jgi:hypothetical protein|nr:hypothetical protein [Tepidisphaeraceae bacterium]